MHDIVFEAATAFTDVRRLQILRRLTRGDVVTVDILMAELSMSDAAVSRHTTKLIRRGYVAADAAGRAFAYRLASQCKTAIHARFFEIVGQTWRSA